MMKLKCEFTKRVAIAGVLAKISREAGLMRCELDSFDWSGFTQEFRLRIALRTEFLEAALLEFEFLTGEEIECDRSWQEVNGRLSSCIEHLRSANDDSESVAVRDLSFKFLTSEFGYLDGFPWNDRRVGGALSQLQETVGIVGRGLK